MIDFFCNKFTKGKKQLFWLFQYLIRIVRNNSIILKAQITEVATKLEKHTFVESSGSGERKTLIKFRMLGKKIYLIGQMIFR